LSGDSAQNVGSLVRKPLHRDGCAAFRVFRPARQGRSTHDRLAARLFGGRRFWPRAGQRRRAAAKCAGTCDCSALGGARGGHAGVPHARSARARPQRLSAVEEGAMRRNRRGARRGTWPGARRWRAGQCHRRAGDHQHQHHHYYDFPLFYMQPRPISSPSHR